MSYNFKRFCAGRMSQVSLKCGADLEHLAELDRKEWLAISCPTTGLRFDLRMLELMDADKDGRIRTPEVIAAIEFLKAKKVDLDSLFHPGETAEKELADVLARQAKLAAAELSAADRKALADWEAKLADKSVSFLGADTAAAEAALAAVEPVVEAFFTPPEDMPLVTEEPDKILPLKSHLNPKHLEAVLAFAEKCVKPVLGDRDTIGRIEWKQVRAAFEPYRAHLKAKPVASAPAKDALDDEERVARYRLHLVEFLENYVNMKRLYDEQDLSIFQTGVLRIDAKEMNLCFHVADEVAHSALAEKSRCCVIYLKLSRPSEGATRSICAVVTAGTVAQLYVGRNGVFYDRDGKDWEAVVTKVVENQVSLMEAFWAPWRKLGESISGLVKKFMGERQSAVDASMSAGKLPPPAAGAAAEGKGQGGGAAMASSVAAIGIGVGMLGAALATLLSTVKGMGPVQILVSVLAVVLIVSLPSVILTWFRLRQRDLGAILNASGWAINRPMRFSMKRARGFTKCARSHALGWIALLLLLAFGGWAAYSFACCRCSKACGAETAPAAEAAN